MLDKGFIHELTSLAVIPLLFAVNPSNNVWICHDYRGLNTVTIKNWYLSPLVRETLDILCNTKYFTKLDVIAMFNRI